MMRIWTISLLTCFLFLSCEEEKGDPVPKIRAYKRLDFSSYPKNYKEYTDSTISFEKADYLKYELKSKTDSSIFFNLTSKGHKMDLYCTYYRSKNIDSMIEGSFELIENHFGKAGDLRDTEFIIPENKVYGVGFEFIGNSATNYQFFVTDSVSNYLHGSMYFFAKPNYDSLRPVIGFYKQDIEHLIKTLKWNGQRDTAEIN